MSIIIPVNSSRARICWLTRWLCVGILRMDQAEQPAAGMIERISLDMTHALQALNEAKALQENLKVRRFCHSHMRLHMTMTMQIDSTIRFRIFFAVASTTPEPAAT